MESISSRLDSVIRKDLLPSSGKKTAIAAWMAASKRNIRYRFTAAEFFLSHNTTPMTRATSMEKMKEAIFLTTAAFLPKYFISTGSVTIPTIIKVETKAAICI